MMKYIFTKFLKIQEIVAIEIPAEEKIAVRLVVISKVTSKSMTFFQINLHPLYQG